VSATLELEAIACPLSEAPDATVLCSGLDGGEVVRYFIRHAGEAACAS
jgi:hypothetical protein